MNEETTYPERTQRQSKAPDLRRAARPRRIVARWLEEARPPGPNHDRPGGCRPLWLLPVRGRPPTVRRPKIVNESTTLGLDRMELIIAALDVGVRLRDLEIAARHADPRSTTRATTGLATSWTGMPAARQHTSRVLRHRSWVRSASRSPIMHSLFDACVDGWTCPSGCWNTPPRNGPRPRPAHGGRDSSGPRLGIRGWRSGRPVRHRFDRAGDSSGFVIPQLPAAWRRSQGKKPISPLAIRTRLSPWSSFRLSVSGMWT